MKYTEYRNAEEFLSRAQNILEQHEAANGLMLGLAVRLKENPLEYGTQPLFATLEDASDIQTIVLMTPPYKLQILARPGTSREHLRLLAEELLARRWPVPGVIAERSAGETFAAVWRDLTGCQSRKGMEQRIYELRAVREIDPPDGEFRQASAGDIDRVISWARGFHADTLGNGDSGATVRQVVKRLKTGGIFFWVDVIPVSIAARARPTRRGETISLVYTPPEYRRRGYATAVVACLAQKILDDGKDFCCLYTDLANPTSNSIYQKVGFTPVADVLDIHFSGG